MARFWLAAFPLALVHWLVWGGQPEELNLAITTAAIVVGALGALAGGVGGLLGGIGGGDDGGGGLDAGDLASLDPSLGFLTKIFEILEGSRDPRGAAGDITSFLRDPLDLTRGERFAPLLSEVAFGLPVPRWARGRFGSELAPFQGLVPDAVGVLESLVPTAQSLATTGLPPGGVDDLIAAAASIIEPVTEQAQFRFEEQLDPFLRERISTFSSDLDASRARELAGISADVGALQTDVVLDLLNRIGTSLPLAASLAVSPAQFALGSADILGDLGEEFRLRAESVRPGARLLEFIPILARTAQGASFAQPGFNPAGSSTANTLSALGNALSGIDFSFLNQPSPRQLNPRGSIGPTTGITAVPGTLDPGTVTTVPGFSTTDFNVGGGFRGGP